MPSSRLDVTSFVVVVAMAAGTGLVAQQLGYDDTPMQPDGKWRIHDSKRPQPPVVTPGPFVSAPAPADAIVLIGPGGDQSKWSHTKGEPSTWVMADGVLQTGKGMLRTKAEFGDIQLHV